MIDNKHSTDEGRDHATGCRTAALLRASRARGVGGGGPRHAPEHGPRLAKLLPRGRLIEIDDSYTLIPEDRPVELSRVIQDFVRDTL
jgi:hypothetical protein